MRYFPDFFGTPPSDVLQMGVVMLVLIAAFFDLRARRIPNWLCALGLLLGLLWNLHDRGWEGFWLALGGAALALMVYVPLFLLRAMGAGDGKLMAAVGAFLGAANWFGVFVFTAVIGAVVGLLVAASKGRSKRTAENLYLLLVSLKLRRAPYELHAQLDVRNPDAIRLPHAVSIALGTISYLVIQRPGLPLFPWP
jgi:prepilin peptidase CpaA